MKEINKFITEGFVSKINENIDDLPEVETLEDGLYEGKLNGYCFIYEDKQYKSPIGILSMFPCPFNLEIKENKVVRAGDPANMFDYSYESHKGMTDEEFNRFIDVCNGKI